MLVTIATWNVNSVRSRLNSISCFLDKYPVSILALQECKCGSDDFPKNFFLDKGFKYQYTNIRKKMLGVAILSKLKVTSSEKLILANLDDCRHISIKLNEIELHNLYIPAGGYEANIETNPKYKYKLDYLDGAAKWFGSDRTLSDKMILLGDLNVAPEINDVWDHNKMKNVVSHTQLEIDRLIKLKQTLDWQDAHRHFIPLDQKVYTWWTYRFPNWQLHDRGRKLDHIWFTKNLTKNILYLQTIKETRAWEKPSDHVPVVLTIDI